MSHSHNNQVYFLCPSNVATGGPELVHQAASTLLGLKVKAYMLYMNKCFDPVHPRFKKYQVPYTYEIEDREENILVIPEIYFGMAKEFSRTKRYAWWMSVDNYLHKCSLRDIFRNKKYFNSINRICFYTLKLIKKDIFQKLYVTPRNISRSSRICLSDNSLFDLHLYQSEYAKRFLLNNGIRNIARLSDYISEEFISDESICFSNREDRILYNPQKGFKYTRQLMRFLPKSKWVPLKDMTPKEVKMLMKSSKIYVDFGPHPGKDRIPREAAINGCIVITSRCGSANYYADIPIDDDFKFGINKWELKRASDWINHCLRDYDNQIIRQDGYRKMIRAEKNIFIEDIKTIFKVS